MSGGSEERILVCSDCGSNIERKFSYEKCPNRRFWHIIKHGNILSRAIKLSSYQEHYRRRMEDQNKILESKLAIAVAALKRIKFCDDTHVLTERCRECAEVCSQALKEIGGE